jgi:hypothetical protein
MKIILAFVLVALIFIPNTAFGWKSLASLYEKECIVDCSYGHVGIDSSKPMNFILLAMISLLGLGLFIKFNRLRKFETFSIRCKHCGKSTRGLKCVYCVKKQTAR